MNIYEKLVDIQGRLKAPKNQRNNFGKYNYRSAEDILEAVKPLLSEHKVTIELDEDIIEKAGIAFIQYTTYLKDGKSKEETKPRRGHAALDLNRKGMDSSQATGSSSSYAKKYALGALFLLDDTKDSDATNTHGKSAPRKTATPPAKPELPLLKSGTPAFDKVKNALAQGFTIDEVKTRYIVNPNVEKLLLT
jgi:hypothetical protein